MIDITDKTIDSVFDEKGTVVLMLYAKWCPLCKRMRREIEQLNDIVTMQIDLTSNPVCTTRFIPHGLPTILVIRDGLVVERYKGIVDIDGIVNQINRGSASGPV